MHFLFLVAGLLANNVWADPVPSGTPVLSIDLKIPVRRTEDGWSATSPVPVTALQSAKAECDERKDALLATLMFGYFESEDHARLNNKIDRFADAPLSFPDRQAEHVIGCRKVSLSANYFAANSGKPDFDPTHGTPQYRATFKVVVRCDKADTRSPEERLALARHYYCALSATKLKEVAANPNDEWAAVRQSYHCPDDAKSSPVPLDDLKKLAMTEFPQTSSVTCAAGQPPATDDDERTGLWPLGGIIQ